MGPINAAFNMKGYFAAENLWKKVVSAHKLNGGGPIVRGREWGWGRVRDCVAGWVRWGYLFRGVGMGGWDGMGTIRRFLWTGVALQFFS